MRKIYVSDSGNDNDDGLTEKLPRIYCGESSVGSRVVPGIAPSQVNKERLFAPDRKGRCLWRKRGVR